MAHSRRTALLRLAVLACCAAVAETKEPQWETINYDCRCGASPVPLGAAATIAECQAKVAGAKRSAGFYEAETRKCFSAKSCNTCWSANVELTVFGQKKQGVFAAWRPKPGTCRYDKAVPGVVATFAGSGTKGKRGGPALQAKFNGPFGVATSPDGHTLFVADSSEDSKSAGIRTIDIKSGKVTTLAGGGSAGFKDDIGKKAQFKTPKDVVTSPDGSTAFVADTGNNRIRAIDIKSGKVSTLALKAMFKNPSGVAASLDGGTVFVADTDNHRIRAIKSGKVTTLAGSGTMGFKDKTGPAAVFNGPNGLATSPDGSTLYVADTGNHVIRAIDIKSGKVSTLAGDVTRQGKRNKKGKAATFRTPRGVAASPDGRALFVTDTNNNVIRAIDINSGQVTTLAGSGNEGKTNGKGTAALFKYPQNCAAVSPDGRTVFVGDSYNHMIRKITLGCKK